MNARDYYLSLQKAIHAAPHVLRSDLRFEEIDQQECFVRGILLLINDYELHLAEYVITGPVFSRLKYRYHLQTPEGELISRWDNAAHHHEISTFPDHRHGGEEGVYPSRPMDISGVLDAVLPYVLPAQSDRSAR